MAKPSVQTEQPSEQASGAELMSIGGTHDDRLQLVRIGEHKATLTVLESDFGYLVGDVANVKFADAADAVHIALNRRGTQASEHRQNLWKKWVHTAMARWLRVGYPADVLGIFDFEGAQVRVTRYTSTRTDGFGIHLATADEIPVTIGVREHDNLILVGHRYTAEQRALLAATLDEFLERLGVEVAS